MSISDEELSRVRSSSKPVRSPSSRNRSRITNGAAVLTDARSAWGRLRLDTSRALISHVGGDDMVSETQRLSDPQDIGPGSRAGASGNVIC